MNHRGAEIDEYLMDHETYFAANRQLWNTRTDIHVRSRFYDVDSFRAGGSALSGIEVEELGDVQGKTLLHLQCHFGLDTLSWARLGAIVTGVDFSEQAIRVARELAEETQLPATFHCHNVLEVSELIDEQFDIVFASYGVLGWLPDLNLWAQQVKQRLLPDGCLYLLEFHPFYYMLDENAQLHYPYFYSPVPDEEVSTKTYTDGESHEPIKEYWWNHSISDIINAVQGAGLSIDAFREYPVCAYKLSDQMIEVEPGRWVFENMGKRIPYMFSIRATRE